MKSAGKRSTFRFTAWTKARVSTPYSSARSASSITRCPRMLRIRAGIPPGNQTALIIHQPARLRQAGLARAAVLRFASRAESATIRAARMFSCCCVRRPASFVADNPVPNNPSACASRTPGAVACLFAFIGFPHADNAASFTARRPDHHDHPSIQFANSDVPRLAVVVASIFKGEIACPQKPRQLERNHTCLQQASGCAFPEGRIRSAQLL